MSAVLRASGPGFDVDSFATGSPWTIERVYRCGEPTRVTRPAGRKYEESGLTVVVSEAGFDDFASQVADAVRFLDADGAEVRRLVGFPGVAGVSIDFGVARREVAARVASFPPELVRRAGAAGIGLELSVYAING